MHQGSQTTWLDGLYNYGTSKLVCFRWASRNLTNLTPWYGCQAVQEKDSWYKILLDKTEPLIQIFHSETFCITVSELWHLSQFTHCPWKEGYAVCNCRFSNTLNMSKLMWSCVIHWKCQNSCGLVSWSYVYMYNRWQLYDIYDIWNACAFNRQFSPLTHSTPLSDPVTTPAPPGPIQPERSSATLKWQSTRSW